MNNTDRDFSPLERQAIAIWEGMPFNSFLGIKIISLTTKGISLSFKMNRLFIGQPGLLHGGVISAVLDMTGAITVSAALIKKYEKFSLKEIQAKFSKGGTIDLRVDYLRPGKGESFLASGVLVNLGKNVSVTQMELHNDKDQLIAIATGTYFVG